MGNLREVFSHDNTPEGCTGTHKSSIFPYKQVGGRNGDHEWLRMTNAFILYYLVWNVQKSDAANREDIFNITWQGKYGNNSQWNEQTATESLTDFIHILSSEILFDTYLYYVYLTIQNSLWTLVFWIDLFPLLKVENKHWTVSTNWFTAVLNKIVYFNQMYIRWPTHMCKVVKIYNIVCIVRLGNTWISWNWEWRTSNRSQCSLGNQIRHSCIFFKILDRVCFRNFHSKTGNLEKGI